MFNSITIDFAGTDDAFINYMRSDFYSRIMSQLKTTLEKESELTRQAIVANINKNFKKASGNLADSVVVDSVVVSDKTIIVTIQAGGDQAPYAVFFDRGGSGPYEIVPVSKKALSFLPSSNVVTFKHMGKVYQELVARSKVMHPGIPHIPIIGNVLQERKDAIVASIREAIFQVVDERP